MHKKQKITSCGKKYYYDAKAANRAVQFFSKYLIHVKGRWAGKPFKLAKWQVDEIIKPLFGWKRKKDGLRRFRVVWVEIPKKNGKSALAAGIALYMLIADNEPGAEIYSAAVDKEQARIVYNTAKSMLDAAPRLRKYATPGKKVISVVKTNSSYVALSADVENKHGINPHAVIIDEVHAHKTPDFIDTLVDGSTAARSQPIIFYITTSGFDRTSICWEYHQNAKKTLKNEKNDEEQLVCIYEAGPKQNWRKKETWIEANPNMNISISLEDFEKDFKKVLKTPRKIYNFKRLRLNIWTQQSVVWLNLNKWDKCRTKLNIEDLRECPCFLGMDLSSTIDLSCYVLVFKLEDGYAIIPKFYVPAENIIEREETDAIAYRQWVADGFITATEGNVIDYATIREDILDDAAIFDIQEGGYDPYNATEIVTNLENKRMEMIPVRQGMLTLSPPTKHLEYLVLKQKLYFEDNPVLRWMASNTSIKEDATENIKPIKKKSTARIDGIVGTIIGLERAMRYDGYSGSVYNRRGIRTT